MSAEYIAYINNKEYGPVEFDHLEALFHAQRITGETYVRSASDGSWLPFEEIHNRLRPKPEPKIEPPPLPVAAAPVTANIFDAALSLKQMRRNSAYPILRGFLLVVIAIGFVGAVASAIALLNDDTRPLGITGVIASLSSIFSALLTAVLLDIADALLAKLD